jgi:hypothetical protein
MSHERDRYALVAKAMQIALVKLPMSRRRAYVIALLRSSAKANWMMYSGAVKFLSTCASSSRPRELSWYREAGH